MIVAKILAVVFSLTILLNAYVVRRIVGTWLFPAALSALFWFAFTFVPLIALYYVPVNPWGVLFICASTIAFSVGSLAFPWNEAFRQNRQKECPTNYFNTPFLWVVFLSSSILSLIFFVLGMFEQGFSLNDMWFSTVATATAYSNMRYAEELASSLATKLSLQLAYLAVTTGGLLFGSARSRRQLVWTLVGSFTPPVAVMLLQSAKGLLFSFIALFFGCILVTRIFAGRLYVLDRRTFRIALVLMVVLLPFTALSFLARGFGDIVDPEVVREGVSQMALSYAFGHLYAFSDWFAFHTGQAASMRYPIEQTGYGFYTFMSLFRLAGSTREVPIGIYDEFFTYQDVLTTNIYTIFRGLIVDFGLIGTMLYMVASSAVIHLSFYSLLVARRPWASVVMFIFTLLYFYLSFGASMLTWTTIPAVAIALSGCLYVNRDFSRGHGVGIKSAFLQSSPTVGISPQNK
jgi:oligosaccharide repeat unit polymerase